MSHEVKEASRRADGEEREKENLDKRNKEMIENLDAERRKIDILNEEANRVKDKLATAEKSLHEKSEKIKVRAMSEF